MKDFIPSTWEVEAEAERISEFKASLVYRVSLRTVRTTQRNSCLEKQTNKQTNNKKY